MSAWHSSAAVAATVAILASASSVACAQARRGPDAGVEGYVVADSWWGKGSVRAPVRRGPSGWQVQLPRGTWIDCRYSCRQTLRQQTVDFWESNGPQAKDGGPGYFHWEFSF